MHYKKKISQQFLKDLARTRELHALLVVNGLSCYNTRDKAALLPTALPLAMRMAGLIRPTPRADRAVRPYA